MLLSDTYRRLLGNPGLIREELKAAGVTGESQRAPVIIDEIQKLPPLLDEVHWMIENLGVRFILCGSSARKLKRNQANLLGGRAVRYELHPLVFPEVADFDLAKALNAGLLPRHYISPAPRRLIQSYIGDYLKEEITAESLTRNIPAFARFLEVAALMNGEILDYTSVARDCAVSAPTAKGYFTILEDTLLGTLLPGFMKRAKRRVTQTPKFYFFDPAIAAFLAHEGAAEPGSIPYGRRFEHFIYLQVLAHCHYSELYYPLAYWRTTSGFEVDLVLGDGQIAVEIKSSDNIHQTHLKGLRQFKDEFAPRRAILVCAEPAARTTNDGIEIMPWRHFLGELFAGNIIH